MERTGLGGLDRSAFTPPLQRAAQIPLRFSTPPNTVPRLSRYAGDAVDFVFLIVLAVFVGLTLALVAGCAALERKR